jgi:hypothetical protein
VVSTLADLPFSLDRLARGIEPADEEPFIAELMSAFPVMTRDEASELLRKFQNANVGAEVPFLKRMDGGGDDA